MVDIGNGSSARRIGENFPAPGGTATQPGVTHGVPAGTFNVLNYGNPGGISAGGNGGAGGGGAGASGGNSAAQTNGTGGVGKQFPHFTGPLIGVPALGPHNGYYGGGGGYETKSRWWNQTWWTWWWWISSWNTTRKWI
mgnify:CR=1 FL=1